MNSKSQYKPLKKSQLMSERQNFIIIKRQMHTENTDCQLCISPTFQTKLVLFSITKQLKHLLNEYVPDFNDENIKQSKNNHSFIQLLKITFGNRFSQTLSNPCNHQKICRYMKRKFKCDSQTFQQLCERLISKLGEKNYQLQVLTSQLKSLPDTAIKVSIQGKNTSQKEIKTSEAIGFQELRKKPEKKFMEPCKKQQKNKVYINFQQQKNQMENQGINFSYQYFYPLGFYFSEFPSNSNQIN